MIWWCPGRFARLRSSALVELTDIAPTLLRLGGLEVPHEMQGRTLLPLTPIVQIRQTPLAYSALVTTAK